MTTTPPPPSTTTHKSEAAKKVRTSSRYGTAGLVKHSVFSSCSPLPAAAVTGLLAAAAAGAAGLLPVAHRQARQHSNNHHSCRTSSQKDQAQSISAKEKCHPPRSKKRDWMRRKIWKQNTCTHTWAPTFFQRGEKCLQNCLTPKGGQGEGTNFFCRRKQGFL